MSAVSAAQFVVERLPMVMLGVSSIALLLAAMCWWIAQRRVWSFSARMIFGGVAILSAISLFFALATAVVRDAGLTSFDVALVLELRRSLSLELLRLAATITWLGDRRVLTVIGVLVAALLLLRRERSLAVAWMLTVAGNGLSTRLLKALFERARPLHEHGLVSEIGWSFPSGHASSATAAYGMLAYLLISQCPRVWRLPIVLSAVGVILLVGMSRVLLQVHYFSDVLAGFASGAAWLTVCILACIVATQAALRSSAAPPLRPQR